MPTRPKSHFRLPRAVAAVVSGLLLVVSCSEGTNGGAPGERELHRLIDAHLATERRSWVCLDLLHGADSPSPELAAALELGWVTPSAAASETAEGEVASACVVTEAGRPHEVAGACDPHPSACGRFNPADPRVTRPGSHGARFRVQNKRMGSLLLVEGPLTIRGRILLRVSYEPEIVETTALGRHLGYDTNPDATGRRYGLAAQIGLILDDGEWVVMRSG